MLVPAKEGEGGCKLRSRGNNQAPHKNSCLEEAACAHGEALEPRLHLRELEAGQSPDANSSLVSRESLSPCFWQSFVPSSGEVESFFFFAFSLVSPGMM